ncbi:MAG TPA: hypothetical protein VHK63_02450 [Candidatus Limnocylindria bacterium]|nr:hypothetical protein [Candidatus Limnocylindria bacterium]
MTPRRVARRPLSWRIASRVERPEGVILALVLAGVAVGGWYGSNFWLAVAIAGELVLGGLGAVWIIGPATARLGFARYATLAVSGVAVTIFGRLTAESLGLLLAPGAALALWLVLWLELRANRAGRSDLGLELSMIGIVFAAAAGFLSLAGPSGWASGIGLTILVSTVPALRTAEGRRRFGAEAVGQALLHLLALAQVAAAVALLAIPPVVGAALLALAFHAWAGAAEALDGEASGRAVALEFGALAVLGMVVALLLHGSR